MPFDKKLHNKIMKQGKDVFEMLEKYDLSREWPLGRERIDVTLSRKTIQKLKELKKRTGQPISRIIEGAISRITN
jgi:hypothetical protein